MNTVFRNLIVIIGITFLSATMALAAPVKNSVVFLVIQDKIVFDSSTVESAIINSPKNISDSYSVSLKLKNDAADKFSDLTQKGIGKQVVTLLNDQSISTSTIINKLGSQFVVTGLTKKHAKQFIKSLNLKN